jgi:hypothetical protein
VLLTVVVEVPFDGVSDAGGVHGAHCEFGIAN